MFDFVTTTEVTTPSLEGLLRFCESKPADEVYCWADDGECLLFQYGQYVGMDYSSVNAELGRLVGKYSAINGQPSFELTSIPLSLPRTFGAAADRCRALLAERG